MKSNNSIFKLDKRRKEKLLELIRTLYPTYDYVKITSQGFVKLGYKLLFIPIVKLKVHITELLITDVPKKLSVYRQGNTSYVEIYNKYLEFIIYNKNCNVIDYLYNEFQKIKSSSKVEILLENQQLFLSESNSDSITIGTIIHQSFWGSTDSYKLDETLKLLNRFCKEPIKDQISRLSFIKNNRL